MKIILEKAKSHFHLNFPFVIYCKPNSEEVIGYFQRDDTLYSGDDLTEKGFVFASFDDSNTILIPENQSQKIRELYQTKKIHVVETEYSKPSEIDKNNFKSLVAQGIEAIEKQEFKKVVLSRKETLDLIDFDLVSTLEKLVYLYPNTFVYCFHHPKVGTWLGATPEQLLKVNGNDFKTIALAGTQKNEDSNDVIWPKKEKKEQQFVTDYIVENLNDIVSEINVSKPYSSLAGSVWHIKTDISGKLKTGFGFKKIIQLLHPTPAVCGLPMHESKKFILENENYNRTFYTGFLGELNIENKTDLFVNLRCMEIDGSKAHLFMGCGVTKDSIPEKEWEESINKSATMKNIL